MNVESNVEFFKNLRRKTYETKYKNLFDTLKSLCLESANKGYFHAELKIDEKNYSFYFNSNEITVVDNDHVHVLREKLNLIKDFMQDFYNVQADVYFHDGRIYGNASYMRLQINWLEQSNKKTVTQTITLKE